MGGGAHVVDQRLTGGVMPRRAYPSSRLQMRTLRLAGNGAESIMTEHRRAKVSGVLNAVDQV